MATLSGLLSAELAATCNALGYYDGHKYHLEPHCRETLRDIIRYLRRDQSAHEIRRFLGNTKLLQTDLLPIIQCHHKEVELFDVALRLIVNLTNPALLVYNEVLPTDKWDFNQYLEIISHLQTYKEAFNDHKIWTPFTERLSILLDKKVEDRDEDDERSIERILILIRNVLHIPASTGSDWRPDNDASIHDQVAWALHQSGMLDLLLYIASSDLETHFYLHLLEIICLLLREQPPSLLAQTAAQRSAEEKNRDDEELLRIRQTEILIKQQKIKKFLGIRHSNFGGTFVVKNLKSTSDKDMIYHKPIQEADNISFDKQKEKMKVPKNRQPLKSENVQRRSALSVRLVLKQFCVEILHAAYNPLMKYVKECLVRGKSQNNDESYYFTAMKFFMEFNRFYNFQVKYVSETMAIETFYFVQKYLENWFDLMSNDKKKLKFWSARMHLALKAYKELLQNLILMDRNEDSAVRESSKIIKSNVFYIIEYREMLLVLTLSFKKQNFSNQYLIDLIETIHLFLKLLCDFCKSKKIVVQGKQVRKKSRKQNKKSVTKSKPSVNYEELWEQNANDVASVLSGEINNEVIPFDATLELDMEQQKLEAIKKIQVLMKSGSFEEAVALLRASREVWPENDTFGTPDVTPEEELSCLREVFLADLEVEEQMLDQEQEQEDEEDEEEEDVYPEFREQNFNVEDLIRRFASPKVIQICSLLLSGFETNSDFTNRCIVKMLHRIAWDCKLPSLLFQASLFIQFQKILRTQNPKYFELAKLATFVIRKFVENAEKNNKIFLELLVVKSIKEAIEVEEGYGSTEPKKNIKGFWAEHEEEELKRLAAEFENTNPNEKMADWILDNLIRKDRSVREVTKKLKEMGLLETKQVKKKRWTQDLDQELSSLYEEFKNNDDPLGSITEKLSEERSRQAVASALLRLGLVQDKKELHKKRKKSSAANKTKKSQNDSDSENENESESDESEDETNAQGRPKNKESAIPKLVPTIQKLFEALSVNKFLIQGMKWVSSCIDDCLEDLENDDDGTEVPLLPLSEDAVLSIENREFQEFLLALNFNKPFEQQEIYWRFPATWRPKDFESRQELINYIAVNEENGLSACAHEINRLILLITGEEDDVLRMVQENENVNESQMNTEDFNNMIAKHCKETLNREMNESVETKTKSVSKMKTKFRSETDSDSDSDDTNSTYPNKKFSLSRFGKLVSSGSEESDEEQEKTSEEIELNTLARRRLFCESSDEDERGKPMEVKPSERRVSQKENTEPENAETVISHDVLSNIATATKRDRIESDDEDNKVKIQKKRKK